MREASLVGLAWEAMDLPSPVPMSGYAARTGPSRGTADPAPRATALAVDDEALVVLDVIGVDPQLAQAVRDAAGDQRVAVTALHTHSGPCVLHRGLGPLSPAAAARVAAAGGRAVRRARSRRRPARAEWFTPVVPGVAHDRRRGLRSEDATLRGLRWRDAEGQIVGCLVSYPCHPTCLGPENRLLSPDYPGFLRAGVEAAWGGVCVFATGCAGDINPGPAPAARGDVDAGRPMADCAHLGRRLAEHLAGGDWTPVTGPTRSSGASVTLEQDPLGEEPEVEAVAWRRKALTEDLAERALMECWLDWSRRPDAGQPGRRTVPVGRLTISGVQVFLLPGEPFLAADVALTARAGGPAMVLGYAGDCPGYFPSAAEYAEGGYEVREAHRYYGEPAPFAEGSLERLVEAAWSLRA